LTTTSRPSRSWALADPGQHLGDGALKLALEDGVHGLEGHRRRVGLQRPDDLLVDRPVLLGDGAGVEEGQELADLHRHALHIAEHGDVTLRLSGEPVELLLLVAGHLPRDAPEALPNGEPGEAEPSREPSAPDAVVRHPPSLHRPRSSSTVRLLRKARRHAAVHTAEVVRRRTLQRGRRR
jgi:hypothetical protein